jgi:RNA polymerase sigma factor (sigma-70 family)
MPSAFRHVARPLRTDGTDITVAANWRDVDLHQRLSLGLDADDISASIGDPERFGGVFERNFEVVRRYAARRLGMRQADDVAAETFARAFRSRATFQAGRGSSVRAWLFGFAVNIVREHERSAWRQGRAYERFPTGRGEADDHTDEIADRLVSYARIEAALRDLSPEASDLLLLVAGIGLSYQEVAAALDIPVGTVKSRVSRARAQVVSRLEYLPADRGDEKEVPRD